MGSGIYQIVNSVDGKRYIGSAVDLHEREVRHFRELRRGDHFNVKLRRAVEKYGIDAFEFETLLICAKKDLKFYEDRCIKGFDTVANGYNIAPESGTPAGSPMSQEIRDRIALKESKSLTYNGETHTYREWDKLLGLAPGGMKRRICVLGPASPKLFEFPHKDPDGNNTWVGKKHTLASRKIMSMSLSGRSGPNLGKEFSDEWRHNLSLAHLGKQLSPESIAKRTEKQKGLKRTEETKKNMSKAQTHIYTYNGETHATQEWEELLGMCRGNLKQRFYKYGNDLDKVFAPKRKNQYA